MFFLLLAISNSNQYYYAVIWLSVHVFHFGLMGPFLVRLFVHQHRPRANSRAFSSNLELVSSCHIFFKNLNVNSSVTVSFLFACDGRHENLRWDNSWSCRCLGMKHLSLEKEIFLPPRSGFSGLICKSTYYIFSAGCSTAQVYYFPSVRKGRFLSYLDKVYKRWSHYQVWSTNVPNHLSTCKSGNWFRNLKFGSFLSRPTRAFTCRVLNSSTTNQTGRATKKWVTSGDHHQIWNILQYRPWLINLPGLHAYFIYFFCAGYVLTLSLQRVINAKFLLQPHQKFYITQYWELGFL